MFHWMHQNGGPDKLKIADVEAFLSTRPWWKNRSHMLETYNGMSLQTKRKFERMYDGTKYAPSARKHISSEFKTRVAFMKCVSRVKAGRRVRRDSKFAGLTKAHVAPAEAAEHKGPTALDEYIAREFPAVLDSNAESDEAATVSLSSDSTAASGATGAAMPPPVTVNSEPLVRNSPVLPTEAPPLSVLLIQAEASELPMPLPPPTFAEAPPTALSAAVSPVPERSASVPSMPAAVSDDGPDRKRRRVLNASEVLDQLAAIERTTTEVKQSLARRESELEATLKREEDRLQAKQKELAEATTDRLYAYREAAEKHIKDLRAAAEGKEAAMKERLDRILAEQKKYADLVARLEAPSTAAASSAPSS
jgi:hypothetical protein